MGRDVLYRHGPYAGQVVYVGDDAYAETLLATGYALLPQPMPAPFPAKDITPAPVAKRVRPKRLP